MGGCENNNAVSDHIWDVLVQGGEDNNNRPVENIDTHQDKIPQLYIDWMTPHEIDERETHQIDKEVRCWMVNLESIKPDKTSQLGTTMPVHKVMYTQFWND